VIATLVWMVNQNGLVLTVRFVPALRTRLGLEPLLTLTIFTLALNALTRVSVTVRLDSACASLVMMVLLVNVPSAPMTVISVELAGLRNTWLQRLDVLTQLLGTL